MTLTIDPEFSSLIPPLTDEELEGLEKSIKEEGCRDALVVWNNEGKQILIDGHNRYKICQKYGIEFKTVEKIFDSREDAIIWMCDTQCGRRNLNAFARGELMLKREEEYKKKARANQGKRNDLLKKQETSPDNFCTNSYRSSDKQTEHPEKRKERNTGEGSLGKMAKAVDVSRETMARIKKIAEKGSDELKQQVRSGDKTINSAFNEIAKKESKRLPTASEYREQVQARHEELKDQKIVSVQEIVRDKRDVALLSSEIRADISKAVKPIDRLYVLLSSKELDVSILTDADKRMAITNVKQAASLLDQIANIIEKG